VRRLAAEKMGGWGKSDNEAERGCTGIKIDGINKNRV
jgi:hypothetical protein